MSHELIYYVYVLRRPDGIPFYVGFGKNDRWLSHEKRAHLRRTHKDRIISNIIANGDVLNRAKIKDGLSRSEAIALEIALIASIGREPDGPLINQTSGGDGVPDLPLSVRQEAAQKTKFKLTGRKRLPETIQRIKDSRTREDVIKKISDAARRMWSNADFTKRDKMTPKTKGLKRGSLSEDRKAKIRSRRLTEEEKLQVSLKLKGRPVSAETRKKIGDAIRGVKRSDETRLAISRAQLGKRLTDDHKRKIGTNSKAAIMSLSPERRSEISRKGWERRRKNNESSPTNS